MNNIKSILLQVVLLLSAMTASAADSLFVDKLSIMPGNNGSLSLVLNNTAKYRAFETELTLPDGLSFVRQDNGKAFVVLTDRAPSSFVISSTFKSEQTLRLVCYSNSNEAFTGNSGSLVTVRISASESFGGGTVKLANTIFTTEQNQDANLPNTETVVSAKGTLTATVNNATRQYGDANPAFTISYAGFRDGDTEASLTVAPTVSTTATVTSDVGDYKLTASGGLSDKYEIVYVDGTLTITKAPLTISAGNYTKKQGGAMPDFKASYDGFKNNETEDVLTAKPVITTDATVTSAPGEYTVNVSGAEARNYEITYKPGVLTVVAADALALTARSYTRQYGDSNPTFGFDATGADVDGTPEITCEATATFPVGTYPIVIRQGSVKNYNVTYVNGTLTITKAPLTISAGSYTKKQGDAMPDFKASYDGFKNGETEDVLTTKPVITTDATVSSAPGEYAVNVSGAEARNYEITYQPGVLTVVAADALALTARSYTRQYGDANPTFGFDATGADVDGVPEITCEATATSPVGTYPVVIRQGSVKNYNVTYVNGTLTITKAPLTISAGSYTKKQGDAMPDFKASYDGFKNGETEDVLTAKPNIFTYANEESAPGEYEVYVDGAEAENYELTYINGKLTVTERAKVATPVISTEGDVLRITCDTEDATIYYTLDGSEPNTNSHIYSEAVSLSASCIIKAFATATRMQTSDNATAEYHNAQYPDIVKVGDVITANIINNGEQNLLQYFEVTSVYPFEVTLRPRVNYEEGWKQESVYGSVEVPVEIEHNGVAYKITKIGGSALAYYTNVTSFKLNEGLVEIEGSAFRFTETQRMEIPNSVIRLGGVNFAECHHLESVVLGYGLQSMGGSAFWACSSTLTTIYSLNPTPPIFDDPSDAFDFSVDFKVENLTLYVPVGSKTAYETAPGWNLLFGHIVEFDPTGIEGLKSEINVSDGHWYTLSGVRLDEKPVKAGVYIHKGKKVVIR